MRRTGCLSRAIIIIIIIIISIILIVRGEGVVFWIHFIFIAALRYNPKGSSRHQLNMIG
jgi:flagellar basal body-associated protein FliL